MATWPDESDIESVDYGEDVGDESHELDDSEARRTDARRARAARFRRQAELQQVQRRQAALTRTGVRQELQPASAPAAIRQTQAAVNDVRLAGKVSDDILRSEQIALGKRIDSTHYAFYLKIIEEEAEKSLPKLFESGTVQTVARAAPALILKTRSRREPLIFGGAIAALAAIGQLTKQGQQNDKVSEVMFTTINLTTHSRTVMLRAVARNADGKDLPQKRKEIRYQVVAGPGTLDDPVTGILTATGTGTVRVTASIGDFQDVTFVDFVDFVD